VRYYRCKCGDSQAWGSMPPEPCEECPKCQTTLETVPTKKPNRATRHFSHVVMDSVRTVDDS
jgi:hypothetical protein